LPRPEDFTAELNQFIQDERQTGGYPDENAVLTAVLEVFREDRQQPWGITRSSSRITGAVARW
jgi:hypothetical protein